MPDDKVTNLRLERRLRRLNKPDGNCSHCKRAADRHAPVGPIRISVTTPEDEPFAASETFTCEFCCWECLGHWAAEQAGGTFTGET